MKVYNEQQGGWVVAFVVVGGLLLLGLMTGLYYFKTNVDQAKKPETSKVAKNDESSGQTDNNGSKTDDEDKTSGNTSEGTNNVEESPQSSSSDTTADNDTSSRTLPQTGPENGLVNAGLAALFVFALTTYLRSRADVRVTL